MPLAAGTRIGPYEIGSLLGAGGMGEVYRARDTQLRRDVAIKVLPQEFARDAERLSRFQREAEALATLNHPNVAHIHGFEASGELRALVMELVEGPTLADRIRQGPLPLAEAFAIARQITDALEGAHARNVIHRDLKPANIKVRDDGTVKVLDFGLAKMEAATTEDAANSPTLTADTRQGVVLGTAAYMSPEQARGRPVDKRTDIWSFGCVLYEMVTGRSAFVGETIADTAAAVLNRDPDWTRLPLGCPDSLRRLLQRCLAKDPRQRLRDIADARLELEAAKGDDGPRDVRPVGSRARGSWWWALAGAASGAAIVAGTFGIQPRQVRDSVERNPLVNATFTRLTDFEGTDHDAAISPDGRFVAFQSNRDGPFDVWLTQVGSGRFTNLTRGKVDTSGLVRMVGFSADGSEIWLGGQAPDRRMRMIPLMGGTPRLFLPGPVINVSWSADGARMVYHTAEPGDPMFVADRTGGDAHQIYVHPQPNGHNHYPAWSRDGRWIYFVTGNWATEELDLWRISPDGGQPERLTQHDSDVTYLTPIDSRTVLYLAPGEDGSGPWLWAYDVERGSSGRVSFGLEKYKSLTASADGRRLVATVVNPVSSLWSVPILDRVAEEQDVSRYAVPTVRALAPRLAAQSVFYLSSHGTGDGLWRFQAGEVVEVWKGADGPLREAAAVSPDGRRVAVVLRRRGIRLLHVMSADGSELQALAPTLDVQGSMGWSPDGQWIVTGGADAGGAGLFAIPVNGGPIRRVVPGPALNPVWSPRGDLIVYAGQIVGQWSRMLAVTADGKPVELPEIRTLIQGERFRFMPDGGLVYMVGPYDAQDFWLLDLKTRQTRQLTRLNDSAAMRTFDITPDGKQIVFDRLRSNSDIVLIDLPRQ